MNKVSGKIAGVEKNIIDYLEEVANHFNKKIVITSGKRSAEYSGKAMFSVWVNNLKRGKIYKSSSLSSQDREQLDQYYKTAMEDKAKKPSEKQEAKKSFIDLAAKTVG